MLVRRFFASALRKKFNFVRVNVEDKIAIVTLADSQRMNALTVEMGENFKSALDWVNSEAKQQNVKALVITGDGDAFSAGGDLNWLAERHTTAPYRNSTIMVDFYNRFLCIRNVGVPTIAAINGAAIGAGMCFTLACDVRIASHNAKLGFTFAKLGIHPGMGSSLLLPRVVSQEFASYLLLSGQLVTGKEAKERGLVFESVPKEETLPRALELARIMAANSPIAVQSCVQTVRSEKGLESGLLREADAQAVAYASQDFIRGINAVKSKSIPVFEGWE